MAKSFSGPPLIINIYIYHIFFEKNKKNTVYIQYNNVEMQRAAAECMKLFMKNTGRAEQSSRKFNFNFYDTLAVSSANLSKTLFGKIANIKGTYRSFDACTLYNTLRRRSGKTNSLQFIIFRKLLKEKKIIIINGSL